MVTDPELLFTDYEAKLADAQRKAEQITTGLNAIKVTERSVDGHVTVTVDASGNVTDLQIAPGDRRGVELAQTIMQTMRRAQSRLADMVQNRLPATVGSPIMDELTAQYRGRYPVPPPEPARGPQRTLRLGAETESAPSSAGPVGNQRRRGRGPGDDVDYSDRGLLR